jgi:ABC-type transport system involved in cytochrome c biogenesis permease subunit
MGSGLGGRQSKRERHRRAFALAAFAATGSVVVLALAFRWASAAPPVWYGSPATFFACVAGLVAAPTFVATYPQRTGSVRLFHRVLVATLGGVVGAVLVLVTTAATTATYDPAGVSLWLPLVVGAAFAVVALALS